MGDECLLQGIHRRMAEMFDGTMRKGTACRKTLPNVCKKIEQKPFKPMNYEFWIQAKIAPTTANAAAAMPTCAPWVGTALPEAVV